MAWVNPETFEVLPYLIRWRAASVKQWAEAGDWCEQNIGVQGESWTHTGAEMQISNAWWFKTEEYATWFKITWL